MMDIKIDRVAIAIAAENAKWPLELVEIPWEDFPDGVPVPEKLVKLMRSRYFLVQLYENESGANRLSISRTDRSATRPGSSTDGITWDELQELKRQAGFGDRDAVEIYPKDQDVVNVANMRHLWILDREIPFAWRRSCPI